MPSRAGQTTAPSTPRSLAGDYIADPAHGPLPVLLLLLTVTTGIIDAVSILSLGRVFVANMTGNIVFIGFALAHAPGFSLVASLVALAGFLVGAGIGGLAVSHFGRHRGLLLRNVVAAQLVLLLAAALTLAAAGPAFAPAVGDVAVALAGTALGMQNAAVRRIAVPDLTTTVLTLTLTGIAADLRNHKPRVVLRRVLSVLAMLLGALGGALLVRNVSVPAALFSASALLALVTLGAGWASRHDAHWQRAGR